MRGLPAWRHGPSLRVSSRAKLRVEESRQMAINLKQADTSQLHARWRQLEQARVFQCPKFVAELHANIDAKFLLKPGRIDTPGLELQDHLANEPVAGRGRQCPMQR